MAYIELKLPPGVVKHGTDMEAFGRWHDSNLVRWEGGSIRPVGGWQSRHQNVTAGNAPRGSLSWVDNDYDTHIAVGTYANLYAVSQAGVVTDITPAGFVAGYESAQSNIAFGGGAYGMDPYGTERESNNVLLDATSWSMDTWGENLIACSDHDGKIYEWDLNAANNAAVISNAPTSNNGISVTEDRFIFALAAGGNPRKVAWCDKEDNTVWAASASNEAGDIELQTQGEILQAIRVKGQTLILTTLDAHSAVYQGPPYVYGFERVGTACGSISKRAGVGAMGGAVWMGQRGFFVFDGSMVSDLPCDVQDFVFKDMNLAQSSKVHCVHNGQFGEVWWFYPSGSSNECDRYVVYDYDEKHWHIGALSRTTCVDRGAYSKPIWFDADGNCFNHENGLDHGSNVAYIESGPISLGAGDQVMRVVGMIPDEKVQGEVTATFKTRFHPNDTERSYGPYSMSNPTSLRVTGRQVRVRFSGSNLKDWGFGNMRLDVLPGGKR